MGRLHEGVPGHTRTYEHEVGALVHRPGGRQDGSRLASGANDRRRVGGAEAPLSGGGSLDPQPPRQVNANGLVVASSAGSLRSSSWWVIENLVMSIMVL